MSCTCWPDNGVIEIFIFCGVGEELRILHRRVERRAQDLDLLGGVPGGTM